MLTEEKTVPAKTGKDIAEYLARGGYESGLNPDNRERRYALDAFLPWVCIDQLEGKGDISEKNSLYHWYEKAKVERDLARMHDEDLNGAVRLLLSRRASETLSDFRRSRYRDRSKTPDQCYAEVDSFESSHPELVEPAADWEAFRQKAIRDFRPEGFDRFNSSDLYRGSLMTYGLFHNPETDEYLVTMRDSRDRASFRDSWDVKETATNTLQGRNGYITYKSIPGNGRPVEQVREQARWLMAEHYLYWMKFAPIEDRKDVEALHAAETVRTAFARAADPAQGAVKPDPKVLTFFPAFRRAYQAEDAFRAFLNAVFDESGELAKTSDSQDAPAYELQDVVRLYEQMSEQDRKIFTQALDDFMAENNPASKNGTLPIEILKRICEEGSGTIVDPYRHAETEIDVFARIYEIAETGKQRIQAVFEEQRIKRHSSKTPSLPKAVLFEHFDAFQDAYKGNDPAAGYFRALNDVFGPEGTLRYCDDQGVRHSHWGNGYTEGGDIGRLYEVSSSDFLALYEKMDEADRAAFRTALNRFIEEVLPTIAADIEDKGNYGFTVANRAAGDFALLTYAATHGSGALSAANWFDVWRGEEKRLLAIATGDDKWNRYATNPEGPSGPQW